MSGKGSVTVTRKRRGEETTDEGKASEVVQSAESGDPAQLARVTYAAGVTLNLGNYESARVDVRLEMPAKIARIDDTFDFALEWVQERLESEVDRIGSSSDD